MSNHSDMQPSDTRNKEQRADTARSGGQVRAGHTEDVESTGGEMSRGQRYLAIEAVLILLIIGLVILMPPLLFVIGIFVVIGIIIALIIKTVEWAEGGSL